MLLQLKVNELFRDISFPVPEVIDYESYLEFPALGLSFIFNKNHMTKTIHVYSEGRDDYSACKEKLPGDLTFAMNRECVRSKLGPPIRQGEETILPILGFKGSWDLYHQNGFKLHVEYQQGEKQVSLITLSLYEVE